jgi:penicillin-binding protein 1A
MLPSSENASSQHWLGTLVLGCIRIIFKLSLLLMALVLCAGLLVGIFLATAYPKLPEMSELTDYRPKLPLRIYSAEGMLLAEFGEEKRQFTRISDIPPLMKNAILAAEDARFFEHHGVDYLGIARAALSNIAGGHRQGASTISMQVARNAFLSQEKTYTRKIYEILLTFKIEHLLSKEEILEIYMNHIFLGHRAYGFAAAAQVYFGKSLADLTISEAAMLAGLPKAPSMYNPINNPPRARQRQLYIIDRMEELRFIDQSAAALAKSVPLQIRQTPVIAGLHGEYAAEIVRQTIVEQYGDDAYTRGLNVTTTIKSSDQLSAYKALRQGMLDFERRQAYRGPEKFIDLPALNDPALDDAVDDALNDHPDSDDILSAVVLQYW